MDDILRPVLSFKPAESSRSIADGKTTGLSSTNTEYDKPLLVLISTFIFLLGEYKSGKSAQKHFKGIIKTNNDNNTLYITVCNSGNWLAGPEA